MKNPFRKDKTPASSRRKPKIEKANTDDEKAYSLTPKYADKAALDAKKEERWQKEVSRVKSGIDIPTLVIMIILATLGTAVIFSASYPTAINKGYEGNYYLNKHLIFCAIGLAAAVILCLVDVKYWRSFGPPLFFAISLVLLVYAAFFGTEEGETSRWINLGFFNLQPSELMKPAIVMMFAWYAYFWKPEIPTEKKLKSTKGLYLKDVIIPLGILGIGCGGVLLGRHLSGTVIVFLISIAAMICGGYDLKRICFIAVPIGLIIGLLYLLLYPYALERITSFFDKNANKMDELYQTTQSIRAIGSGGLFGVGIGMSRQKYGWLAAAHTDFIFAVWCEECGFVGAVILILLFLFLIWRCCLIAVRACDTFSRVTAFGITMQFGIQIFLNMLVAIGFINTGVPLPFISYGGSSTVTILAECGILLSISKHSYRSNKELFRNGLL